MNALRPKLRLLLDEGAPADVGNTFQHYGHEVIPFEEVVKRGSDDVIVYTAALANDAILVGFDNDMRGAARRYGVYGDRFKRLSLIKFFCPEPMAAKRLAFAMSLIEHEWNISNEKVARRLHIEIGTHLIRTFR